MYFWISLFAIFASASAASPTKATKQYRDYVYNKKTDAFYKLHTEGAQLYRARSICTAEGAKLLRPESQDDLVQVHAMFKRFPDLGEFVLVESDGQQHDSVEEATVVNFVEQVPSTNKVDVIDRNGDVDSYWAGFKDLPFVCKVPNKDVPYNAECDVYATDYISKISTTGSCYRVARVQANWNEAYALCQAEGAHLAIMNNAGELEVVKELLQKSPRSYENWQYFVGIRAEKTQPRVFKTVTNQTLAEVGYQPWAANEPNNEFGVEYCVSMLRSSGLYNDTVCRNRYSYVCEKERRV